jgi:putative lipoic acid-binding regulatory protein
MSTREAAIQLLNSTHDFPQPVMIKAIGIHADGFEARVVAAVRDCLQLQSEPICRTRLAKSGKHIAVTLEPEFESAEGVLAVYEALRKLKGLVMVM